MKYDDNKHKNRGPLSSALLMDRRHPVAVGQSLTCEPVRAVVEYVLSTEEKKIY